MPTDINFQPPAPGFDSYLNGIIPQDQAVTAGAFSVSVQQIRNITKVETPSFAKVVYSMESTKDLPKTNGTDIPTDTQLANVAFNKQALGSGLYGTYTMSNYFGAMSGLPYSWGKIYELIKNLQTQKLNNIYSELYLATTWKEPDITVDYTTYDIGSTTYYTVTGITINSSGGYGRGSAPKPEITISNGGSAKGIFGTDKNNIGSVNNGTYGRLIGISDFIAGPDSTVEPIASIEYPPIDMLPVQTNGNVAIDGTNSPDGTIGWPDPMNDVVQGYIDQANAEIIDIRTNTTLAQQVRLLNSYWGITGTALKHEQRARYIALSPVPVPYDNRYGTMPTSINIFTDSVPNFGKDTMPNMTAQTLEQISDVDTTGGQSIIALMREARNQERLAEIGIELDNNLPIAMDIDLEKQLMLNGTLCGAVEGIQSPCGDCVYTIPADATTEPYNYYDNGLKIITGCKPGSIEPILNCDPNPIVNNCTPVGPGPTPPTPINPFVIDPNVNTFPVPVINSDYTGTTLKPSIYNVNDAIDKVIECNCDCWVK